MTRFAPLLASLALASGAALSAQQPLPTSVPALPVFSMGQPPVWQPYAAAGAMRDDAGSGASALLGVHKYLLNPVDGILGAAAEAYVSGGSGRSNAGLRLRADAPALALGIGADWNVVRGRADLLLTYESAIRRGGLLGHGTMLRLDWLPTRGKALGLSVKVPIAQPFAGRTRPRQTEAELREHAGIVAVHDEPRADVGLSPAEDSTLRALDEAAARIRAYTTLWAPGDVQHLADSAAGAYAGAIDSYLRSLAHAFALAVGDSSAGEAMARRGRAILLDDVLVPYDSIFGEVKESSRVMALLTARAQSDFDAWLRDSSRVSPSAQRAASTVAGRWLGVVRRVHEEMLNEWKDPRLVWMPLQLALAPDQYDEQPEMDSLVARVVGRPFTDQNALTYLASTDLPLEIARSIFAARSYHVLWTHDFSGRTATGAVDQVGYSMVADVYFPALTAAVKRYDATGRLPVYMILLDQYFYEPRNGRLWMTMLENPLHASVALPDHDAAREQHLRERQTELRAAVAASRRLQAEAGARGGDRWLRGVVKVHVSITQPSDFSFRSVHIVPPLPFAPDNLIRDHRKMAFYDLNEANPYDGALLVMGIGIAEQYASASWEDRGYRLRGPAALDARAAVRRLLRQNGFRASQIPEPLREVRGAPSDTVTEHRMNQRDYVGRALQVQNERGFGRKESSIARAMLYTLTPPGSVVIVPDPLWLSESWAAMLAGAAARGSRVIVIAPALANAPSPQAPLMAQEHDVFVRLLRLAGTPLVHAAGGELRVGIFAAHAQANDVTGRVREVRAGLARAPWIRQLIPFDDHTLAVLDRSTAPAASGENATSLAPNTKVLPPQLHQKTQLIARPGAIAVLVRQPGWDDVLARGMRVQSQQTSHFAEQLGYTTPDIETDATRSNDALLRAYEQAVPATDRRRLSFYFSLGSQNQDDRGEVSDGESQVIVSGFHAAAGLVDLFYIMARSQWPATQAELEHYVPAPGWIARALAHLGRPTL